MRTIALSISPRGAAIAWRRTPPRWLLLSLPLLFALSFALPGAARAAPFRDAQPQVLETPPEEIEDDGSATVDAFRRRYERQRKPAVALLWNRELSERVVQSAVQRQSVQGHRRESASETGTEGAKSANKQENSGQVTEVSTYSPTEAARRGLDERSAARLRGAFLSTLAAGGLRPLDRTMLVRAAALQASGPLDMQANEMRALQQARFVLEVLMVSDAQAALGMGFSVTAREVASAATLFTEYVALPLAKRGSGRWVAVNGADGFERAPQGSAPTVEEMGRAVALVVMARLSSAW